MRTWPKVNTERLITIAVVGLIIIVLGVRWVNALSQKQQAEQRIEQANQTALAFKNNDLALYRRVCDRRPVPEAAALDPQASLHPVVVYQLQHSVLKEVLDPETELTELILDMGEYDVPAEVKPKQLQDLQLVACIEEWTTEYTASYSKSGFGKTTGTCKTIKHHLRLTLREAKTARVVFSQSYFGAGGCGTLEGFSQSQTSKTVQSKPVDPRVVWEDLKPWILSPHPTPTFTPLPTSTLTPTSTRMPTITPTPMPTSTPTLSPEQGELARACQSIQADTAYITALAISPDGKLLVTASRDTIKLWRLPEGTLLQTLVVNPRPISSMAISPDGKYLVTGSQGAIKLWRLSDGAYLRTLRFIGDARSLAISPDGTLLASSTGLGDINLWTLPDGALLRTLNGYGPLEILPSGRVLVSQSADGIQSWLLPDGKLLRTLELYSGFNALAISPDGKLLVMGGNSLIIDLWTLPDWTRLKSLSRHNEEVSDLAISPDSKLLVSSSRDSSVKLWSLPAVNLLRSLECYSNWEISLAISPDGSLLATTYADTVALWTLPAGEFVTCLNAPDTDG